jgi:poly-gamma-glutamate system protein
VLGPSFRRLFFHNQRGYRSVAFALVGTISIGAYAFVVRIPDGSVPGWVLAARLTAVDTAIQGQQVIARTRTARGLPSNPGDTFHTGLIGIASSPITTDLGSLPSHRTTTDPVFAAAVVQMLYRAGVRPGNLVAVGMTASYPSFDLDVYAGIEAIGATPVVISSLGSSQYGANEASFTWLDMEGVLYDAGVIHHRSLIVGPGGSLAGADAATREQLAERSGLPVMPVLPLPQDINFRENQYVKVERTTGKSIAAFVDVGGAAANIGSASNEAIISPGLSRPRWSQFQASRLGVMGWMALQRVPIVAMISVRSLANRFGIPFDPHLRPTARDIAPPPANPIGLAIALIGLVALVVAVHRRGLFRVPDWELPPRLREATRQPGKRARDPHDEEQEARG